MLAGFSDRERALLALPVPALGLPALIATTDRELAIRAFEIDCPDEVFPRGEKTLVAVMKILGAIDSTYEERLKLIHIQEQ